MTKFFFIGLEVRMDARFIDINRFIFAHIIIILFSDLISQIHIFKLLNFVKSNLLIIFKMLIFYLEAIQIAYLY